MDGQVEQDQAVQDGAPAAPAGPPVIQGGDSGTRAVTGPPRTTYLEGRAKQQQALHKGKAEQELEEPEQIDTGHMSAEAGSDPTSSRNSSSNRQGTEAMAEASEELLPDSAMASELLAATAKERRV